MLNASLLVIQGLEQGTRYELAAQQISLGRSLENEIRVLDTEASRVHASLERAPRQYILTDRHSSNGTFVNGRSIQSAPLHDGDQIQIGRTIYLYQQGTGEVPDTRLTDRVELRRADPADRSNIVSQMRPEVVTASPTLLDSDPGRAPANFRLLYQIAEESVRTSYSLEQLLQRMLDLTIHELGADRGCLLLSDPVTGEIRPHILSQRLTSDPATRFPVSRTIVDYVLKSRQGVRTTDAQHDQRFDATQSIMQAGIREALCVPMQGRDTLLGAIYVDITTSAERVAREGARFHEDHLRLLIVIGRQAALAVENSRYQQAVLKAERLAAMGQTIATLSHHIKNILQGVRGGSYLIDLGLNDHNEELVRKGWHIVEKNQNKIYHLVMDMLTFSKERQPVLRRASINDTVGEVVELMQSRAEECLVQLQYQPAVDLPDTTFDPEGIHRAVLNIVTNAIDAVEGGRDARVDITTGLQRETNTVWVTVADNGPGISPEQLPRLFNIFESTKGARGTGLGLAVSQKILREHGGEVTVASEVGRGSRFTLSWPQIDEEPAAADGPTLT